MPRLIIDHLPPLAETDAIRTLRHWLTFEDGRIYYQDEFLEATSDTLDWTSQRGDWHQLPTPPMTWPVVGIIDHGGFPLAMLANGESYLYARADGEMLQRWLPFTNEPVPGSYAHRTMVR